jgi:hypothetical protein
MLSLEEGGIMRKLGIHSIDMINDPDSFSKIIRVIYVDYNTDDLKARAIFHRFDEHNIFNFVEDLRDFADDIMSDINREE